MSSNDPMDSLSAIQEGLQRASLSAADEPYTSLYSRASAPGTADADPYAAQFAALGSMTSQSEDDDDCNVRVSSTPDASTTGGPASTLTKDEKPVPRERCVKARMKLGHDVVHFRPGNRIILMDTLNAQLLSARCTHCKEMGCLIIDPPPEERRGFFIIVEAFMSLFVSRFTSHLKLWCSRCEARCYVRFLVAPDGSVTSWS